ncbi:hypothetical protein LINPERHAP2_LOCUS3873 [Linum perenne]
MMAAFILIIVLLLRVELSEMRMGDLLWPLQLI